MEEEVHRKSHKNRPTFFTQKYKKLFSEHMTSKPSTIMCDTVHIHQSGKLSVMDNSSLE